MAYHKHANRRYPLPSDSDYWVELRRLSLLDAQAINRDYLGNVKLAIGGATPEVAMRDMNGEAAILAILRAVVLRWNIDGPDGESLPISDASLKDLEPEDLEFIVHTAVAGTALESTFGKASIKVAEVDEAAAPDADSVFTAGPSRP